MVGEHRLEVVAVAGLALKHPEEGQGEAHTPNYTLSVYAA